MENTRIYSRLTTCATSWYDGLSPQRKEALLIKEGRSWFTFDELIEQYVKWLETEKFWCEAFHKRIDTTAGGCCDR